MRLGTNLGSRLVPQFINNFIYQRNLLSRKYRKIGVPQGDDSILVASSEVNPSPTGTEDNP